MFAHVLNHVYRQGVKKVPATPSAMPGLPLFPTFNLSNLPSWGTLISNLTLPVDLYSLSTYIAAMEMATLTALPHEILHAIFSIIDIPDIASVRFTCRSLHRFISDNRLLFKDLYLQRLVRHISS